MMEAIHRAEVPIILWVQNLGYPRWLVEPLSWFGVETLIALGVLLFLGFDRKLGVRLLALYFAGDLLNLFLKVTFHAPRPYWFDESVRNLSGRGAHASYGFPSGHVQNAASSYGTLALATKRAWAWGFFLILILLVSFSRVYLGVHFPTDALGGLVFGLAFCFVWARAEPVVLRGIESWSPLGRLALVGVILALTFGAAGLLFHLILPGDTAPWAEKARSARELSRLGTPIGALFGLAWGTMQAGARFDPGGPWKLRLIRIVVGGGVVGGIVKFTQLWKFEGVTDFSWRFVLSCVLTLWVTWWAPILFLRWKLAKPL